MAILRKLLRLQALTPMGRSEPRNLIFTCPVTKQKVQHRVEAKSDHCHEYESVTCLACAGVHFINMKTGEVLRSERA